MPRDLLEAAQLAGLLGQYRPTARLAAVDRLTGASKKGVYRVTFDDGRTAIVYSWSQAENYWPAGPDVMGDPFRDATGADLLAASQDALTRAGIRTPRIYAWDRSREFVAADLALVEDIGGGSLEDLIARDPTAAAGPIRSLGAGLRTMGSCRSPQYGKVALVRSGLTGQDRRPEDVMLDRAMTQLDAACALTSRLVPARAPIAELLAARRAAVLPRAEYGLVHGELGPDHVLLADDGQPVIIDIEGLTYFDVEWEHAFLHLRFAPAHYRLLGLPAPDQARVAFYLLAQRISLIEAPLRIAGTDYPDRDWMLDLADYQIGKVLAELTP